MFSTLVNEYRDDKKKTYEMDMTFKRSNIKIRQEKFIPGVIVTTTIKRGQIVDEYVRISTGLETLYAPMSYQKYLPEPMISHDRIKIYPESALEIFYDE